MLSGPYQYKERKARYLFTVSDTACLFVPFPFPDKYEFAQDVDSPATSAVATLFMLNAGRGRPPPAGVQRSCVILRGQPFNLT